MMMPPIADDIAAAYLTRPLPPPTSVELHPHQHQHQQQRKWKPSASAEAAPNCPRCDSPNTKFCYYNNYSLAQPRYFCKGCRRYWTKGGSLRNVPVGGGCRKNRRGRSSSTRLSQDARGRGGDQTPSTAQHQHGASSGCGGNSAGMLEDIAGSGVATAAASSTTSSSGGTSRASEGSDIDLAVLYAKYLSDQSSENESSPDGQKKLAALELPGDAAAADAGVVVDVEPTFEFDYAAVLGQQIPPDDPAACGFATTSGLETAQLPDLGFDGQFQYLLPETDSLSSGMDDAFWVNSLPIGSSMSNSMWQQQQCPGDQFVLPMIPDQQQDLLGMMGPLAHHQSLFLGSGAWPAFDSWSIDAVTRL